MAPNALGPIALPDAQSNRVDSDGVGEPAPAWTKRKHAFFFLSLGALGVVYGDIGTSPLYAIRESFSGHFGVAPTPDNVLGILSLVTWSLVLIVSIKYLVLVLRADNAGEGGVLALTALISPGNGGPQNESNRKRRNRRLALISVGLFGAALLYGDGILTPAISVLGAVEGLKVAAPSLERFGVPLAVAILAGLFLLQKRGTSGIGILFGPVMIVWFAVLVILGIRGILHAPQVLAALNPAYAGSFLLHGGLPSFLVLGAVFLVVTGAEALYADLGHFGRGPIQFAWFGLVFPALLLNYFGQGALVLSDPSAIRNPFYLLAPGWAQSSLIVLSTLAAVIASQAVISGVFSLTMQAVQLDYWPRLDIRHTSPLKYGQIYIPPINWALMVCTIALVVAFGSSSALAAAYGLAIVCTMLITTLLLYAAPPDRWGWHPAVTRLVLSVFLLAELTFLGANLVKFEEGGWVPLLIAASIFAMMAVWRDGRRVMGDRLNERLLPVERFLETLDRYSIARVSGNAIYMNRNPGLTPTALLQNFEHQKVLHQRVLLLTIAVEQVSRIQDPNRVSVESLGQGFYRVVARYGFMERPNIPEILSFLKETGLHLPLQETTFFLGHERLMATRGSFLARWKFTIFSFLSRNAQHTTTFYGIPPNRVVEVGSQIEV